MEIRWFDFIVHTGRALLFPVYEGTFEGRSASFLLRERVIHWTLDIRRSIDYLGTRGDIDVRKLAYYGFSTGAWRGPIFTAIEPRFKASVLLSGGLWNPTNFPVPADRPNDRIQVFRTDGTFVEEQLIAPRTLGDGSVWDIAFSRDPEQQYLYLADGKNMKVYVIERQSLEILTSFGDGGRQPGQFFGVHSLATDSKGNIYTTETYEGKRVQKFVYRGLGRVPRNQGVVWPKR